MRLSKTTVVVAIPTNGNDGREQMSGVFDYASRHTNWSIQIVNTRTDIANGVLEAALKNANGVLLSIAYGITEMSEQMLCENPKLKFVVTNDHLVPLYEKSENCRTLLLDNESIGRDAARYLLGASLHTASYMVRCAIPGQSSGRQGFALRCQARRRSSSLLAMRSKSFPTTQSIR